MLIVQVSIITLIDERNEELKMPKDESLYVHEGKRNLHDIDCVYVVIGNEIWHCQPLQYEETNKLDHVRVAEGVKD